MCKLMDVVSGLRLSTVVPGRLTDDNTIHELRSIDLAMKLHYLNCLYFFKPEDADDNNNFTVAQLKLPMFSLLTAHPHVSGRIRRGDDERPCIKCNDCGVRIAEARSSRTVEEVARMNDQSVFDGLVYKMELGPDLGFSPLVALQFTWFKCGGLSIGLRWAHVLGDAFSASAFVNTWANLFSHDPTAPVSVTGSLHDEAHQLPSVSKQFHSAKRVNPVGNHWIVHSGNNLKMRTHSFHINGKQVSQLRSKVGAEFPPFEVLSAILWKLLAKIRGKTEPRCVTICRRNPRFEEDHALSNSQIISTLKASFSIMESEVGDLVKLISNAKVDEKLLIEKAVEEENGKSDFIVYGAKLTFVDLKDMGMYKMKLKGQKLVMGLCSVDGVGEEGIVLIAPIEDGEEGCV
uniref:Uncharacterized protein n=1 Tax=Kalanchoe fedtschenkoi TaxID=63787 RepID=A0A7N0VE40_KALFE